MINIVIIFLIIDYILKFEINIYYNLIKNLIFKYKKKLYKIYYIL